MVEKVTLTMDVVARQPVTGKQYFLWDKDLPGFGLRVTPAGTKAYVIQYKFPGRSDPRKVIAKHPAHTAELARKIAKRPYYIRIGDQEIFGMAGLWDASTTADGTTVESCSLITLPANRMMAAIHNGRERMPAILRREDHAAWLGGTSDDAAACLAPYADERMIAWPVSTRVNSVKNNDPALIGEQR